jgi:hypothetical protein
MYLTPHKGKRSPCGFSDPLGFAARNPQQGEHSPPTRSHFCPSLAPPFPGSGEPPEAPDLCSRTNTVTMGCGEAGVHKRSSDPSIKCHLPSDISLVSYPFLVPMFLYSFYHPLMYDFLNLFLCLLFVSLH